VSSQDTAARREIRGCRGNPVAEWKTCRPPRLGQRFEPSIAAPVKRAAITFYVVMLGLLCKWSSMWRWCWKQQRIMAMSKKFQGEQESLKFLETSTYALCG
jgi:hypothetical protein